MVARAAMGLELPGTGSATEPTHAVILYHDHIIYRCVPRSGRLIGPRPLAKSLEALLRTCEAAVRKRIAALPRNREDLARLWAKGHGYWAGQVRKYHMTGHYLRKADTQAFGCWALPEAVRLQLVRQCLEPGRWPLAQRLRLVLIGPVAGLGRLEEVAVYLRAPDPCGRKGRKPRGATGNWWPVPLDHVTAKWYDGMLVVVVE